MTHAGFRITKITLLPKKFVSRLSRALARRRRHLMMKNLKGIIHVGANLGQERDYYAEHGLNVLWIEPIPWIFEKLKKVISGYPNQQALSYLVLDKDGDLTTLHIASNEGASSSVMDLALHQSLWPSVHFTKDIQIQSYKLDTIIEKERINIACYDGIVLDTQGSELLVLTGAQHILTNMRMISIEVG